MMNYNPITIKELKTRGRTTSKNPIYFDNGFIPACFIDNEFSENDLFYITPEMVYQFLNRENQGVDYTSIETVTEADEETVLQSIYAIKTFFRSIGSDIAKTKLIEHYIKKYWRPGTERVKGLTDIIDREKADIEKVSKHHHTILLLYIRHYLFDGLFTLLFIRYFAINDTF